MVGQEASTLVPILPSTGHRSPARIRCLLAGPHSHPQGRAFVSPGQGSSSATPLTEEKPSLPCSPPFLKRTLSWWTTSLQSVLSVLCCSCPSSLGGGTARECLRRMRSSSPVQTSLPMPPPRSQPRSMDPAGLGQGECASRRALPQLQRTVG